MAENALNYNDRSDDFKGSSNQFHVPQKPDNYYKDNVIDLQKERERRLSAARMQNTSLRSSNSISDPQKQHPDNNAHSDENTDNENRFGNSNKSNIHEKLEAVKKAQEARNIKTQTGSLLNQIDFLKDVPFVAAALAAMLKDLITLATFETIILPIIFTTLCTIFIFMMMVLVNGNGKRKVANRLMRRGIILVGCNIVGGVFPFTETLTVLLIYYMTLKERMKLQND